MTLLIYIFFACPPQLQRTKLLNGPGDVESGPGTTIPQKKWLHFISPIFVQAFTLTFLAEWGDRSQLTTIVLAAREVSVAERPLFFASLGCPQRSGRDKILSHKVSDSHLLPCCASLSVRAMPRAENKCTEALCSIKTIVTSFGLHRHFWK